MYYRNYYKNLFNPNNIKISKDNVSNKERIALKELKNDTDRVNRIQDKGYNFVLLDKLDYVSRMKTQLDNPIHYIATVN
jgi:hypothetical protein